MVGEEATGPARDSLPVVADEVNSIPAQQQLGCKGTHTHKSLYNSLPLLLTVL